MHAHIEKLFDIRIKDAGQKYPVYHPDVKVYEVSDKTDGHVIGLLYADYYARPGEKNIGAWTDYFRENGTAAGIKRYPLAINSYDFAKPAAGQPLLLSPEEVKTLFHEFGHALHTLLSKAKYPSVAGLNCAIDFLELPSQLQQNWMLQEDVLATFAKHHQTGQPLAPEKIKKIIDMDKFNAPQYGLYMTFWAMLDMKWSTTDPQDIKSVEALEDEVFAESSLFPRGALCTSTSFDHLLGYAAGFYGYKWAETLEADIFEEFRDKGIYDSATAKRVREKVYEEGGVTDAEDLIAAVRGRKPDADAMFKREGLAPEKTRKKDLPCGPDKKRQP